MEDEFELAPEDFESLKQLVIINKGIDEDRIN
jgi:hypothetical protein